MCKTRCLDKLRSWNAGEAGLLLMVDPHSPLAGDADCRGASTGGHYLARRRPRCVLITWVLLGLLIVGFLVLHVATGGLGQH